MGDDSDSDVSQGEWDKMYEIDGRNKNGEGSHMFKESRDEIHSMVKT